MKYTMQVFTLDQQVDRLRERVELSIKTKLVNTCSWRYGPFAHTNRANFAGLTLDSHRKLMDKIHQTTDRSKKSFIKHFFETYTSEAEVPPWNRILPIKPIIPDRKNCPKFHVPQMIENDRIFAVLSVLVYSVDYIAPKSRWKQRLIKLWTERHPQVLLSWMGIPKNWNEYDIWNRMENSENVRPNAT